MGMVLVLQSVSDENISRIIQSPALIWRLVAPDDPDAYLSEMRSKNKQGLLARLFRKKPPVEAIEVPELAFAEGENRVIDLDKAWHGIHFCLNQTEAAAEPPMDFLMDGGLPAGNISIALGPARLFSSKEVLTIHEKLNTLTKENLRERYNPARMAQLKIYPNIWTRDLDEGFDYIAENFVTLKGFIANCASHRMGMLLYLC